MGAKYIKPEQIVNRITTFESERTAKGFKPGWMFYRMQELCKQHEAHLTIYEPIQAVHHTENSYIASLACKFSKGEMTLSEIKNILDAMYEQDQTLDFLMQECSSR